MAGENRYLFPRIIKFLDQALEDKSLERKPHVYTTYTQKTQRHTWLKCHGIEVNIIIQGSRENKDVFNYCKYLGLDYMSVISQLLSVRCFLEGYSISVPNKHYITESVYKWCCSTYASFRNPGKQGKAKRLHDFLFIYLYFFLQHPYNEL